MAQPNQSVTAEKLISASVRYNNNDDASRVYDISANVCIENGNVNNFESGEVRKVSESSDNMAGMGNVASFSAYGEKNLNLNIHNADDTEAKSILEAVYAFMSDVRANVSINPVTIA